MKTGASANGAEPSLPTTPRMPFGKHKGERLEDIPDDYLEWLLLKIDLRADTRMHVEAEYRLRNGPPPSAGSLLDIVNAGFRALALKYHPDHGGDSESMRLAIESCEFLKRMIRHLPETGKPHAANDRRPR